DDGAKQEGADQRTKAAEQPAQDTEMFEIQQHQRCTLADCRGANKRSCSKYSTIVIASRMKAAALPWPQSSMDCTNWLIYSAIIIFEALPSSDGVTKYPSDMTKTIRQPAAIPG